MFCSVTIYAGLSSLSWSLCRFSLYEHLSLLCRNMFAPILQTLEINELENLSFHCGNATMHWYVLCIFLCRHLPMHALRNKNPNPTSHYSPCLSKAIIDCLTFLSSATGNEFLQQQGIETGDLWYNMIALGCITIALLLIAYIQLRRIKKEK